MTDDAFRELIHRVRAGDEEAMADFIREFGDQLRRFIRELLTDPRICQVHSASDLFQSILFDFYLRLAAGQYDFANPSELIGFLRTIAANKVHKVARGEKAQRRDVRRRSPNADADLQTVPDSSPSPSEAAIARDLLERVLGLLPADLRDVAIGRGQGRTWEELAVKRGVTPEALRKRFDRSLDEAVERLNPENLEP